MGIEKLIYITCRPNALIKYQRGSSHFHSITNILCTSFIKVSKLSRFYLKNVVEKEITKCYAKGDPIK